MSTLSHEHSTGIDAIFQFTGSGVQLFSGAIFYVIIVRLFTTTAVGAIAFFLAVVGLFSIVFSFGLGSAAQHFISYHIGKNDFQAGQCLAAGPARYTAYYAEILLKHPCSGIREQASQGWQK